MGRFGLLDGLSDYAARFYLRQINQQMLLLEGRRADVVLFREGRFQNWLVQEERWEELAEEMITKVKLMRRAGAEFVVIPSFTLHRVADAVQAESGVPILRMDDCLVQAVARMPGRKLGIVSTTWMGWDWLGSFEQRLGGRIRMYPRIATRVDIDRIALENRSYDEWTRRKRLWAYVEAAGEMIDRVDVILNCSVEMARMVGLRNVRKPFKEGTREIPVVNAMDLHIAAIVQAALASGAYFPAVSVCEQYSGGGQRSVYEQQK